MNCQEKEGRVVLQHNAWLVVIELHHLGSLVVLRHRECGSGIFTGHTCWRSSFSVIYRVLIIQVIYLVRSRSPIFYASLNPFLSLPEVGRSQSRDMAWDADRTSIHVASLNASASRVKSFSAM